MANNSLLIDTGFFLALKDSKDVHYKRALELLDRFDSRDWITTWPVLTEVFHMLPSKNGMELLKLQEKGLFQIFDLKSDCVGHFLQLFAKYDDLDLADASLVIAAEALNQGDILSVDKKDFARLRWDGKKAFNNLFFS